MAQVNSEPGVPYGGSLLNTPTVAAQISTQTNPSNVAADGINSIVMAEQALGVTGQVYNSPGGILNKAQNNGSTVTTGGGP